jgi:hypothetical protein
MFFDFRIHCFENNPCEDHSFKYYIKSSRIELDFSTDFNDVSIRIKRPKKLFRKAIDQTNLYNYLKETHEIYYR